ncbi:MAG: ribonuclease Y [bacterium]|nr:ribonuclease Y [bacterium]
MQAFIVGGMLIGALAGFGIGYWVRQSQAKRRVESAEAHVERIITEAKEKAKELELEGKEQALASADKAKKDEQQQRQQLDEMRERLEKRESRFDEHLAELEKRGKELQEKKEEIDQIQTQITEIKEKQAQKLETIAKLTGEQAKEELLGQVEDQEKEVLTERLFKLQRDGDEQFAERAKDMLATAMLRYSHSQVSEHTTTVIPLPSEDMKGRIIGKEGRNIKVLEQLTGVEIIVDETPGMVLITGFSLLRRYLAKRVLEELIKDGRIQPARIEETYERVKLDLAKEIKQAGEGACYEVGITGLDPRLVMLLGRLKFRTSYGQNNLMHSMEVSQLAGMLAEMVGADVPNCKKGGLLHDIGKALDHEVEGGHPEIGYNIMKKFGLPEEIAYHAIGHHEDRPKTIEAIIVKVADALSGGRPGARRDSFDLYIQRLEELEKIATQNPGVEKAFAIQAGRELRIFVRPNEVDDWAAAKMAKDVAAAISAQLTYPGEIKVTLIRENRVIEYAR